MTNSTYLRQASIRAGLGDPCGDQPSDSPCERAPDEVRTGAHLYHDAPVIPDWYHQFGNGPAPRGYDDFDRDPLTLRERALLIGGLLASIAIVSLSVVAVIVEVFK